MNLDFGRVVTAMVTPFDTNLNIDWAQTEVLVNHLIEQQTDSIVVCGTTGESPTLSDEEKLQMFERVVQIAAGRCKVIAGTGSNNTAHSIELTQKAEEIGVDGILLVTPYYNRPNQEGLYAHFKAIAQSAQLPMMLYNIPSRSAVHLTAETTIRLAEDVPNIVATKESSGNLSEATKIVNGTADDFRLYSGDDPLTLPILSIGGYGVVSVASHLIGRDIQQMISAYVSGQPEEAAARHGQLFSVFEGLFICPNPVTVKYALQYCGLNTGSVRLPLVPPNEEERQVIEACFAHLKAEYV